MKDTTTTQVHTPELTTEERVEMRTALMGENAQNAMAFQTEAVGKFGPAAGIFIRQLVFWDTRGASEDGFIYKSRSEMHEETGLNQKQQQKARRALVAAGVLEEEERAVGALRRRTMHYRPNLGKLMEILHPDDSAPEPQPVESERVEVEQVEHDSYEPDSVPVLTDEDAPEEQPEPDWLPDDFDAQTPLDSYMKPYSESRTRTPIATPVYKRVRSRENVHERTSRIRESLSLQLKTLSAARRSRSSRRGRMGSTKSMSTSPRHRPTTSTPTHGRHPARRAPKGTAHRRPRARARP